MHNDSIYCRKLKSIQFKRTSIYLALKSDYVMYNQIIDPLLIYFVAKQESEEILLEVPSW